MYDVRDSLSERGPGWSEERFLEIRAQFEEFLPRLAIQDVKFIPLSALNGDNVVDPSPHTPWYSGPTLLGHLETVHIGTNTWIGNGAIVLADVGARSIVAAGSVVVTDLPDDVIVGGTSSATAFTIRSAPLPGLNVGSIVPFAFRRMNRA